MVKLKTVETGAIILGMPSINNNIALTEKCFACLSSQNFAGDCAVVGHKEFTNAVAPSDFKQMVEQKIIMVDKSRFIKEVLRDQLQCILITRPRRFGKTLNLSMLKYFLTNTQNTSKLFEEFWIAKDKKFCADRQNKHPVVYLDFSLMKNGTGGRDVFGYRGVVSKACADHKYLEHSDKLTASERQLFLRFLNQDRSVMTHMAIKYLMSFLKKHHGKRSVVLVDDCDLPLANGLYGGSQEGSGSNLQLILEAIFKNNAFLEQGVIMGVCDAIRSGPTTVLSSLITMTIGDQAYSEHFGFLENEVEELLLKTGADKIHELEDVRRYYGGYHIGLLFLYNPRSIMMYATKKVLRGFWVEPKASEEFARFLGGHAALPILKAQMLVDGVNLRQTFVTHLDFSDVGKDDDTFWTLLTQLGYLTFNSTKGYETACPFVGDFQIPNHEVRLEFDRFLGTSRDLMAHLPSFNKFVKSFEKNDTEFASSALSTYLNESRNFHLDDYPSRIVLGLLKGLEKLYGPTINSVFNERNDFCALIMEDRANYSSRTLIVVRLVRLLSDKSVKKFLKTVHDKIADFFPKKTTMHFTRTLMVSLFYDKAPQITILCK